MKRDPNGKNIIWSEDDKRLYSFEVKGVIHTVASYFNSVHGLRLIHPKMPIIFVGNKECFPVEFLFQALCKMKNSNDPEQVNAVFGYNEEFSGTKNVQNIMRLSAEVFKHLIIMVCPLIR